MRTLSFGDIIFVPYPFTDMNVRKCRPGVVVSNSNYNAQTHHVWIMMITRAKKSSWAFDLPIVDHESAGIFDQSKIRFKIACLDQNLIQRKLGVLGNHDMAALRETIADVINDA